LTDLPIKQPKCLDTDIQHRAGLHFLRHSEGHNAYKVVQEY